jgi:hypothetical protein
LLLLRFSLSLFVFDFWQFEYTCLHNFSFNSSYLEILWCLYSCLIKFGAISAIISSKNISTHLFFPSFSEAPIICMLVCLMVSYKFLKLCSLFSIF